MIRLLLKRKAAEQSTALLRRQVIKHTIEQELGHHQLIGTVCSTYRKIQVNKKHKNTWNNDFIFSCGPATSVQFLMKLKWVTGGISM